MRARHLLSLSILLAGLNVAAARAASYSAAPIARFGDMAGSALIQSGINGGFEIGTLNNNAQLTFVTETDPSGEALVLASNGTLTPVVMGGADAPGGQWPADVIILSPAGLNQLGNIAFTADLAAGNSTSMGTFLWNASTQQYSAVEAVGMPVTFTLTFARGGNWITAINDNNEVAFVAIAQDPLGQSWGGDFFYGQDGKIVPIALPGDKLDAGSTIVEATTPSLNNAGVVAFTARRSSDPEDAYSAFQWTAGARTPIAIVGTPLPDGKTITSVLNAWVNNQNGKILLAVTTDPLDGPMGVESPVSLYQWNNGALTPIAVPGQTMPDGSMLVSVQDFGVSAANDLGQHAFLAILDSGATAAYVMDADGKLSLALKSGMDTSLGTIQNVGQGEGTSSGISLNKLGQIALTVQIGYGPDTIVLLTPEP